jgi:hypothetical protein
MDLDSLYKLAGIAAFIIGGINFVIVVVAKTFWNLTFLQSLWISLIMVNNGLF